MKLKYTEVKVYREAQLAQQNQCCALCGQYIEEDAVLDHDHKTGLLRQVLHRGCNSMLGKIENSMPRSQVNIARLRGIAQNLIAYIETQHTDILHPTYKTLEEKLMKKKKKGGGRGRGR
jgi:hypothetical protein